MNNEAQKRRGRGLGKKPAMLCTSLRLPKYVMEFFETAHPKGKQSAIREVLIAHVDKQTQTEP